MNTLQFKTNINCDGCVASVTPTLNRLQGVEKWSVNTTDPNKILTVETSHLQANEVTQALEKAGFKAEEIIEKPEI